MNRPVNRPRMAQPRPGCPRAVPCAPVQLTEFNRELRELPLAMAYVPIQSRALCRGTLFPQLDLPFERGNCL